MPPHSPLSEALLFYAARADHLDNTVRPALNAGLWVICDRFSNSTRVYQGEAGGLPGDIIDTLERHGRGADVPRPDADARYPGRAGAWRAPTAGASTRSIPIPRPTPTKSATSPSTGSCGTPFATSPRAEPERCVVIDAAQEERAVFAAVWQAVQSRLLAPAAVMARAPAITEFEELPEADRLEGFPHPRETKELYGHADAERLLAEALASGRMHHAWLLTGPQGIGKATLAYRFARAALAAPDERDASGQSLAVAETTSARAAGESAVASRAAAHPPPL